MEHAAGFQPKSGQPRSQRGGGRGGGGSFRGGWGKPGFGARAGASKDDPSATRLVFELCDPGHFSVSAGFSQTLNDVYRKHGGQFRSETRLWCFPLARCAALVDDLVKIKDMKLALDRIPPFVLNATRTPAWAIEPPPQSPTAEQAHAALGGSLNVSFLQRLLPYQRAGVMAAVQRGGRVMIGDEMGLGKTVQALAVALHYQREWPLLVLCPSSLRATWATEITRWLNIDEDNIFVAYKGSDRCSHLVCIAAYDLLARSPAILGEQSYRVVIADESHYLKTASSKRTKVAGPLITEATRAIMLTGTPALSRPVELFSQLNALSPNLFSGSSSFELRYCNAHETPFGWDNKGSSHLAELHLLLHRTVLIRRLKKDVLQDLPAKVRQRVFVDIDPEYRASLRQLLDSSARLDEAIKRASSKSLDSERQAMLIQLYRMTGVAKIKSAIEYLDELLFERGVKVLVFAHHQNILDAIANHFFTKKLPHIRIDGATPPSLRQDLCDSFQTNDACRAALLSITAAGVGLTLHAATCVVFVELFWNPGQIQQAEDRAHRIGQVSSVDVKFLVCKGTADDTLWSILDSKLGVLGRSLNGSRDSLAAAPADPAPAPLDEHQSTIEQFYMRIAPPDDFAEVAGPSGPSETSAASASVAAAVGESVSESVSTTHSAPGPARTYAAPPPDFVSRPSPTRAMPAPARTHSLAATPRVAAYPSPASAPASVRVPPVVVVLDEDGEDAPHIKRNRMEPAAATRAPTTTQCTWCGEQIRTADHPAHVAECMSIALSGDMDDFD